MAYDGIHYVKTLEGAAPELWTMKVGATAVKAGDFVKIGATQDVVIPITATSSVIVGLAISAGATDEYVTVIPATGHTIFRVHCASTKKFVKGTDDYTACDFSVFTSGAMALDPATASTSQAFLLTLYNGSPDNTAENEVLFKVISTYRLLGA